MMKKRVQIKCRICGKKFYRHSRDGEEGDFTNKIGVVLRPVQSDTCSRVCSYKLTRIMQIKTNKERNRKRKEKNEKKNTS